MKIIFLILSAGLVIQAEKFGIRGRKRVSDEAGIRGSRRGKQAGGIFGKKIWKQEKVEPKCHPSRSNCRELQKGNTILCASFRFKNFCVAKDVALNQL